MSASIRRRLAAFAYESLSLFALVFLGSYLYDSLTQHRHALEGRTGLQVFLFLLLGLYFVWFWTHGGQTLAMKTWHLRLEQTDGGAVSWRRALARYVLSWLWLVPALMLAWLNGPLAAWAVGALLAAGIGLYAWLATWHPDRQFVHDALCGTRLVRVARATTTARA